MNSSDFRLVRLIPITAAKLIASGAPEEKATEYAAGTTYSVGDVRGVSSGTAQAVYESLQSGNTGNSPASSPAWWRLLGTVYAVYAANVTYAKDDIVTDLVNHQLYQSMLAGNVGQSLADKTKWLALGATNRMKAFDKAVNSQTSAPGRLTFTIAPGQLANTLMLLNVAGAVVTVSQSESGYSRVKRLVRHDVLSWYDFYYEEPIRAGDVVFDDIPPYPSASLTVTVENGAADAKVGACLVGKYRVMGKVTASLNGGVLSYSTSTEDAFGNRTMVKRFNAKRLNLDVLIPAGFEDEAFRVFSAYTDTEIGIIAGDKYAMGIGYGFLGQWNVPRSGSGRTASIEFKGLV